MKESPDSSRDQDGGSARIFCLAGYHLAVHFRGRSCRANPSQTCVISDATGMYALRALEILAERIRAANRRYASEL